MLHTSLLARVNDHNISELRSTCRKEDSSLVPDFEWNVSCLGGCTCKWESMCVI